MYYELYLDVFFLVNLMMDYMILRLVNKLMKCAATRLRSFAGSLFGAICICLLVVIPIKSTIWNIILAHALINTIMVRFGCNITQTGKLIRGVGMLYVSAFLCGGVFQILLRYTGYTFFIVSIASYLLIWLAISLYEYLKKRTGHIYEVKIHINGTCRQIKGLYDTGNRLKDPWNKKPVSILDKQALEGLCEEDKLISMSQLLPHYIPYVSLGNPSGTLLVITAEEMRIKTGDREQIIKKPVIGIAKEKLSTDGSYQLILNPNLIDE